MLITCQSDVSLAASAPSGCPQGEFIETTCSWSILSDGSLLLSLFFFSLLLLVSLKTPHFYVPPSYPLCPVRSPSHFLTNQELMGSVLYNTLITQHTRQNPEDLSSHRKERQNQGSIRTTLLGRLLERIFSFLFPVSHGGRFSLVCSSLL